MLAAVFWFPISLTTAVMVLAVVALGAVLVARASSGKAADLFALNQANLQADADLKPVAPERGAAAAAAAAARPPKYLQSTTNEEEAFLRRLGWSPSSSQFIEPLTDEERLQWELKHLNLPKMLADRRQQRTSGGVTHFTFRHDDRQQPQPQPPPQQQQQHQHQQTRSIRDQSMTRLLPTKII